ncbi:ATP-binding protein [Roseibaca sp. Y0-43]|uniref:ATP-binding protein n=1 Tax=Roseibaca sp. Y0-43 TaxID=2816854 RepID=UPI001D0C496B|nr:ATP-binding protein [Roseibaca sp. Y0-43]MCC1481922.1 ATP-binding protein [Roseibaca sp. Y0-43]
MPDDTDKTAETVASNRTGTPGTPARQGGLGFSRLATQCRSSLTEVRALLQRVDAYLCATHAPDDWREDMNIILAEVLSNIARHGYAHEQGLIELEIQMGVDQLDCCVSDHGRAFDPDIMGRGAPEPTLLREGGYGWFLIRSLAHGLTYQRANGVNCLTFHVPVGHRAAVATP